MKGVREPNQILRLHANHAPTRAVNVSYYLTYAQILSWSETTKGKDHLETLEILS